MDGQRKPSIHLNKSWVTAKTLLQALMVLHMTAAVTMKLKFREIFLAVAMGDGSGRCGCCAIACFVGHTLCAVMLYRAQFAKSYALKNKGS